MPGFSFKKKCSWCEQYEAAQRGEEVSDVQHVMPTPWQQSVASIAPVTTALLAINTLVFILMVASGVSAMNPGGYDLIRWGSNFTGLTLAGQPWRLFTYMFLHGGVWHLAMNMFFLYQLGAACERLLGSVSYALMYLLSGIAGGILSLAWHPVTNSVGASGALFGILGAMIATYKFGEFSMPRFYVQASLRSMLFCAGINLLLGIFGGIDNAAHIGGLITGFIFGFLVAKLSPDTGDFGRRAAIVLVTSLLVGGSFWLVRTQRTHGANLQVRVSGLLQQNRIDDAIKELERSVKSNPGDMSSRMTLASLYERQGRHDDSFKQSEWVLTHASPTDYSRYIAGSSLTAQFITNKQFAEGEKYFSAMTAKDASDAVAHEALAELAEAQDHSEAAIAEFQKVIDIQPNQYIALAGLGRIYAKLHRYDDSIVAYKKAIELSRDEDDEDDLGFREALKQVEAAKAQHEKAK
jgi:membrane associated rhomboid family serine protease/Tfp pilus assembly protein PilF